ncbi:hypothetical protein KR200_003734 [Drosophila serrata]|nr:hypothetical protein KR200_003734 [Drosophila serrata]
MTSSSNVLTIGTETNATLDEVTISKNRKAFFESDFEKRMQKILLNGEKPLAKVPDDTLLQRFSANELKKKDAKDIKKSGRYYYEFGTGDKINGWMITGPAFEPKGVLRRVKAKITKDHWIADNVVRYSKDSREFILQTVSKSLDEESSDIYQYLSYLNDYCNKM